MCIKSCKPLNPSAPEWRPHQHQFPATQPSQKLPPFYHQPLVPFFPIAWFHTLHCYTPFTFPAIGSELKSAHQTKEKKGDESCVDKLQGSIVNGRKGVYKVWKPKRVGDSEAVGGGCAASLRTVPSPRPRTTVMIRNIPNQLRRNFMLEFIDSYCSAYSLEYDFMYLPMDFIRGDNLGYAFVNFTSEDNALAFKKILHNYKWGDVKTENGQIYPSRKICLVTWARIQGKERLLRRFEGSVFDCKKMDFLPVVFEPPRGTTATPPAVVGELKA